MKLVKRFLKSFWQDRRRVVYNQLVKVGCAVERLGGFGKVSGHKSGNTNAEQEDKNKFKNAIEGKLNMQSRANEILHDRIIEEIKEMEHKKMEETLNLVKKENDLWRYQNEKQEAKIYQGARKFKKYEDMACTPPRNKSDWHDCEEARSAEKARGGWSQRRKRRDRLVPGEEGEDIKKSEKESDSSGIRRNAGRRKRSKECGGGRQDFCVKCGQCSAEK